MSEIVRGSNGSKRPDVTTQTPLALHDLQASHLVKV